jgi:hypothetical protein
MITIGSVSKLGKNVSQNSRPVGVTCIPTCRYYGKECYAGRIEAFRGTVKAAWAEGLDEDFAGLRKAMDNPRVRAHRMHVGGDFCRDGKIDRAYLARFLRALHAVRAAGNVKPVWTYTHAWRELVGHLRYLQRLGVVVYASTHTGDEAREAGGSGYRVAQDAGRKANKTTDRPGREGGALRCPEQIGTGHTCSSCRFCFTGKPTATDRDIVLFRH